MTDYPFSLLDALPDADVLCDVCVHDHEGGYNDDCCRDCEYAVGNYFEKRSE